LLEQQQLELAQWLRKQLAVPKLLMEDLKLLRTHNAELKILALKH
jgi:hypothetical protein